MSSFIIRDALGPAVATSNQRMATYRRFHAAWPHNKYIYSKKLVYYDGHLVDTPELRKFLNIIGMKYKDLEDQDYDEIDSCWFYLKPPTLKNAVFTALEMLDAMGMEKPISGYTTTIKFRYSGKLGRRLPDDTYEVVNTVQPNVDIEFDQVKAMYPIDIQLQIMANPGLYVMSQMNRQQAGSRDLYMYANNQEYSIIENESSSGSNYSKIRESKLYDKPLCQIVCSTKYGWYALFDDLNINFEEVQRSEPVNLPLGDGYGLEWTVEYKVIKTLEETDQCLVTFQELFNERSDLPKANGSLPYKVTEADFRTNYEVTDTDLWPNGRLSVPGAERMKKKDFVDMLATCIDTDYKVEKASRFERFIAVVIILVAVVVTIFSMGSLAGFAWPAAMAAISFAFAMGAIVLGVGSALLGYFGGPSANSLVKVIGNIAQYVGLIATVLGVTAFVGNFVKSISAEAIMKAATKEASLAAKTAGSKAAGKIASEEILREATQLASSNVFNRASSVAFDAVVGKLSMAGDSITGVGEKLMSWIDSSFTIYKYYDQNYGETADIMQKNEDLKDDLADLNEQNANSKMMVMGQDVYAYSLGSYDAIAETNLRIDRQGGGWYASQDPCASIT